ncbi:MAG: protein jag [Xenococcaceae cyanobacterium]
MMEQQIQRGKQWLEELLRLIGIPAAVKIEEVEGDRAEEKGYWLTIDETNLMPEQTEILIGQKGETIDAIQYLANTLLNIDIEPECQRAFTVELNGYRVQRQAQLRALAEKVARQVRKTGKEVEMKSLSSAERRQVHTFLKDSVDLETESRGQEPDRRLVVRLR